MKILVVSVFSNHMFNWILQLKGSHHQLHWIDVNDANTYVNRIDFVGQTVKWKRRVEYPGRYWIKNHFPETDKIIEKYNSRNFLKIFEKKLKDFKPDVVQSFEMHSACVPVVEIMKKHPKISWIYSAWGNDVFYYQKDPKKIEDIRKVYARLDYMFADCTRDLLLAEKYGFNAEYLGTFPGGGGYDLEYSDKFLQNFNERKIILVKGYEHKFGRAENIMQAIFEIQELLGNYEIVVFAATDKLRDFLKKPKFKNMMNLKIHGKIGRDEVLKLMGKSLIYVGNSISDGTPNTLLEAIIMECFPIQSDPGGATAETIQNGKNGFLIKDPMDVSEIANHLRQALEKPEMVKTGITYNSKHIKPKLDRQYLKVKVLEKYQKVEDNLR
ncbi:glycosyltransferase involved in cell wall biosynthesis [Christiangramia gaetbulicola]|uniref:Glycosyltransferase involved in cell wall biosynthesis n=1 Tax=Christiangramia gaetbulicola TaxID=703340 RepID=A0A2T6AJU9_9FLAO|nr:glycosyltransferase [Christiangramia gaetbulicola]PTX44067.1 glycosyltransferase involved in cell wall biosynthesis [Christiangramia gaetbulicola]